MALDFPNSPTIGDEFTGGGFTWVWTGTSWDKVMAASTSGNGFSLIVGSSGNTTYAFSTPQPAGAYSFTSELADNTFDIYLISVDNTNVGYANATSALEASGEFDRVVLYGATTNDIINFEYKPSASPATSGDVVDGAAPFLTSATPTTLESIDDTTTVTGGNFASDVGIVFTGQDAVDRPAKNIVRSSSTSLIVTRPDAFPVEQEPFTMTATNAGITNPSTNVNKLTDYFDAGGGITWVTTSPLPTATKDVAYTTTLEATDADATSVVYSLTSGSLPTGLSLNGSTGVISGTPTAEESQTFTVTATDAGGNSSAREFVLGVIVPSLEYLVIAGGGGGGGMTAGGGGGGGYRSSVVGESSGGGAAAESLFTFALATNYTVTVGAGGDGSTSTNGGLGSNGSNSVFASITSDGGGGGGGPFAVAGLSGGSGGGGGGRFSTAGGSGTVNQGYDGGIASTSTTSGNGRGGGGGGAGSIGSAGLGSGDGGSGVTSSITGSATGRAGGGGGGGYNPASGGFGYDGGGNGGTDGSVEFGANGAANTGGGGGGSADAANGQAEVGGNGGSGVVILRYSADLNVVVGAGLSSYTLTDGTDKVTVFTAGSDDVSFELAVAEVTPVEFLVVAGGGGASGSQSSSTAAGGGGAGGYLSSVSGESSGGGTSPMLAFAALDSVNYTVTIGAGGPGASLGNERGTSGVDSTFSGITAFGGGGSGGYATVGQSGGSGGGSGNNGATKQALGISGQGFAGGASGSGGGGAGSGGGGAGSAGETIGSGENGGDGGLGVTSSITGSAIGRAGGGAGAGNTSAGVATDGGGAAAAPTGDGTSGAINTGGGGGGASTDGAAGFRTGGSGGSGVVILRYPAAKTLTVGAGITADPPITVGANKITVLKSGTDTISLS